MYGPLNGPRVALVSAAVVAAIACFIAGYPIAGIVLILGILAHGFGWVYLYNQRDTED